MFVLAALLQTVDPLAAVADRIRPDHDMLHYHLAVSIPDVGSAIRASATVSYIVRGESGPLVLDFDPVFTVDSVTPLGRAIPVEPDGYLRIDHWGGVGDTVSVGIHYRGVPTDGLFIQDNVHGERTAFADNWPNRARHWFPSEDHPSDKATVSYDIEVPRGWKAVANGRLGGVDSLPSGRTVWRWRSDTKIPVYTMVIGAGPLTVHPVEGRAVVRQELWTFPQDSAFAADGPFARADLLARTYETMIGPFPYAKLAHVESSTRFGGMENSSAIFYTERGYARRTMGEGLVAHETAHQWFGDAVTEFDWHHLWLSEGFASYFGPLYFEAIGEDSTFREAMARSKTAYLQSVDVQRPVIDTRQTDLFRLLNRNNYQKGAWILHMLRGEIGDSAFFGGVRDYYATYRDSTALTADLMEIMERHSGRSLRRFFEQWLLRPGHPILEVVASYDAANRSSLVRLTQVQPRLWGVFDFGVPIATEWQDGAAREMTAEFRGGRRVVELRFDRVDGPPRDVAIDPRGDLLVTTVPGSNQDR